MAVGSDPIADRPIGDSIDTTAPATIPLAGGLTFSRLKRELRIPEDSVEFDDILRDYTESGLQLITQETGIPVSQTTNNFLIDRQSGELIIQGRPVGIPGFGVIERTSNSKLSILLPVEGVTNMEVRYYNSDRQDIGGEASMPCESFDRSTEVCLDNIPDTATRIRFITTSLVPIDRGQYTPLQDALIIYIRERVNGRNMEPNNYAFTSLIDKFKRF